MAAAVGDRAGSRAEAMLVADGPLGTAGAHASDARGRHLWSRGRANDAGKLRGGVARAVCDPGTEAGLSRLRRARVCDRNSAFQSVARGESEAGSRSVHARARA